MKILVAGASGFLGRNIVSALAVEHEVTVLGRDLVSLKVLFPKQHQITWEMLKGESATEYQLIINLCGESIAGGNWTPERKRRILESRVNTTEKLVDWALTSKQLESLRFINASAIGIYGLNTIGNTEDTGIKKQANCFSQEVVFAWESALKKKLADKISYVFTRFGVVLKKNEGMLKKLEVPYKLALGSVLGSGEQKISWIHIDDLVRAIQFIIQNPSLSGPVNIVAPEAVSQRQFSKAFANALRRPCFFRTPAGFVKLMFGQMGKELLLSGQSVLPKRLSDVGFSFNYPTIEKAFFHEYQKKSD